MANDNTMGAPTEGLGQTVTFAARSGGGVPQTTASNRQSLRMENRGGGAQRTAQALQVPPAQPDATVQALFKLGGEILRPHVEAERQAKFDQGMQKAMQGQAITEIVDEQPWYSKLFGSTSLVDGARAYTAAAKATSVAVELETSMESLRTKSPAEFAKYITDVRMKSRTGDSATDMMLAQQLNQSLPAVMKGQAKAHLRYKQVQLDESMEASHTAGFAMLGALVSESNKSNATKDGGDVLEHELALAKQLTPPPEVDRAHFNKGVVAAAVKSIMGGNFATASFLQQSRIIDSFSPAEQVAIREATSKARTDARLGLPLSFADDLSELQRMSNDTTGTVTPTAIKEKAAKFNERYTKHTGDPAEYIRMDQVAAEISQWQANQDRLLAEAARRTASAVTAQDKEAAKLAEQGQIATAIKGNGYVKEKTAEDKRGAWVIAAAQAKDPEDLARMRAVQATMDNPDEVYSNKFQSAVTLASGQAGSPAALHSLYQEYKLLEKHGTTAAAQVYAGKAGKLMAAYDRIAQGTPMGPNEIHAAYTQAIVDSQKQDPKLTQAQVKAHAAQYASGKLGKMYHAFPNDSFAIRNPDQLAHDTAPFARPYLAGSEAADVAFADARASGKITVLAGWHWQTLEGYGNFSAAISKDGKSVASDERNRAFNMAVEDRAAKLGITVKAVGQTVNDGDDPQVYIMGMDKDRNVTYTLLKASEVGPVWAKRTVTDVMQGPALNPDTRGLGESALERAQRAKPKQ